MLLLYIKLVLLSFISIALCVYYIPRKYGTYSLYLLEGYEHELFSGFVNVLINKDKDTWISYSLLALNIFIISLRIYPVVIFITRAFVIIISLNKSK